MTNLKDHLDDYLDDIDNFDEFDELQELQEQFDPMRHDRQVRRKRKPKAQHNPKKDEQAIVEEIADTAETLEGGFETTYQPSKYEFGWLLDSVRDFYDQALITDILAVVKGGKEASVYRCQAHESVDVPYVAAKIYRPRMFRQLRNDQMYRQGRTVIGMDGKEVTDRNKREMRAMRLKSGFGQQMSHTSWLMYEFDTLQKLYDAGGAVPKPYATAMNAILMGYVGDEAMPAPTLIEINLERDEAPRLFHEVLRNIELMLSMGIVHGDLSAYNILYWEGEVVLIDFPQVAPIKSNPNARDILKRDITRVCDYFRKQGVTCNPNKIFNSLWAQYGYEHDTTDYSE